MNVARPAHCSRIPISSRQTVSPRLPSIAAACGRGCSKPTVIVAQTRRGSEAQIETVGSKSKRMDSRSQLIEAKIEANKTDRGGELSISAYRPSCRKRLCGCSRSRRVFENLLRKLGMRAPLQRMADRGGEGSGDARGIWAESLGQEPSGVIRLRRSSAARNLMRHCRNRRPMTGFTRRNIATVSSNARIETPKSISSGPDPSFECIQQGLGHPAGSDDDHRHAGE